MSADHGGLTILEALPPLLATKRFTWNPTLRQWLKKSYDGGKNFHVGEIDRIEGIDDLGAAIQTVAANPRQLVIRGALIDTVRERVRGTGETVRRIKNPKPGTPPSFEDVPRSWLMVDVDNFTLRASDDLATDPESAIANAIEELLPECFQDVRCFWQLSASAGFTPNVLKVHLFFWLSEPIACTPLKAIMRQCAPRVTDLSVYQAVQPHYVATPEVTGAPDPIPRRFGFIDGMADAVALPAFRPDAPRATGGTGAEQGTSAGLDRLGDGGGLAGFHIPLRTATLDYARRCRRFGGRNDAALIETLRAAIEDARLAGRGSRDYLNDDYLQRQIDGAFLWLDGLPDAMPMPEPPERPNRLPVGEARRALAEAVGGFFARCAEQEAERAEAAEALAEVPAHGGIFPPSVAPPPPVEAIRADLGLGKSHAARAEGAAWLRTRRAAGDKRPVVIAVPTAALGHEQAAKFNALPEAEGLAARVRLGRERDDPDAPGETMCRRLDLIADVAKTLMDPETSACRRMAPDGAVLGECEFYRVCGYQRQKRARADLWFVAHESLFLARPKEIGQPSAVVVDENPIDAALFGHEAPWDLTLDGIAAGDAAIPGDPLSTRRLAFLRGMLARALEEHGDIPADGEIPLRRDLLLAAGFDPSNTNEAFGLEWLRKIDPGLHPGLSRQAWRERVAAGTVNQRIPRFAALWRAAGALVAEDGPERSGWLSLAVAGTPDGAARVLRIKGRKAPGAGWEAPTLFLDATLQPELLAPIWPTVARTADIAALMPHQRIRQVADAAYSLRQMAASAALANVHAVIAREARRHAPGRVLAVAQADIEGRLRERGRLPATVALAHHNAVAGKDTWRDVAVLIAVGRTAPPPRAVERMADALTGAAIEPVRGWYPSVAVAREMADGSHIPAQADRHPHPIAEAFRWRVSEGELIQIIGRPRGVNRTADDPVDILLMTNTPIPMPVERLTLAADLDPSPTDMMLALGGVTLGNAADASRAYPELWATADAARQAFSRARSVTSPDREYLSANVTLLAAAYQRQAAGAKPAKAILDRTLIPDPAAWLAERLGPMAWVRVGPEPPPPDPPRPRPAPPRDADLAAEAPATPPAAPATMPTVAVAEAGHVPRRKANPLPPNGASMTFAAKWRTAPPYFPPGPPASPIPLGVVPPPAAPVPPW